jgi:drug/metabolite transporter (DMT)-like permease
LATGAAIAVYSVTDGIGARLAGNAIAYTAWMSVIWMVLIIGIYLAVRGRNITGSARDTLGAIGGGTIALTGYFIVVWAMSLSPMGPVSALRETSVVFAAILARLFMAEPLTLYRLCACCVIAGGAIVLGSTT